MSATNITSKCRIASIAPDDAMILPHDANPGRMKFSESTRGLMNRIPAASTCTLTFLAHPWGAHPHNQSNFVFTTALLVERKVRHCALFIRSSLQRLLLELL